MEIISYVQGTPRSRKLNFAEKTHKRTLAYSNYSTQLRTFRAQKVRNKISVRYFLSLIGQQVSKSIDYIKNNKKTVLMTIRVAILLMVLIFLVGMAYFHITNFTGSLKIPHNDSLDFEKLNKLMENFALEGIAEYDENGALINGQQKTLQPFTQPVKYQIYKVEKGDTISGITKKFGLNNVSTLISVNDIGNVRQLASGQKLKIPSIDGIIYTVKNGDSINSVVAKNKISLEDLLDVNELTSDVLIPGQQLFIPGVALDSKTLKEALGDMFILPIQRKFRWSSLYGSRIDPISGVNSFHTGVDMACPQGTPIVASMSGTVVKTDINRIKGNYVIIDHGNGYQTLYYHMSKIIAKKGQWVSQGTTIGLVGSTGYSTGPHLHFTVYKNGKMINPMTIIK